MSGTVGLAGVVITPMTRPAPSAASGFGWGFGVWGNLTSHTGSTRFHLSGWLRAFFLHTRARGRVCEWVSVWWGNNTSACWLRATCNAAANHGWFCFCFNLDQQERGTLPSRWRDCFFLHRIHSMLSNPGFFVYSQPHSGNKYPSSSGCFYPQCLSRAQNRGAECQDSHSSTGRPLNTLITRWRSRAKWVLCSIV